MTIEVINKLIRLCKYEPTYVEEQGYVFWNYYIYKKDEKDFKYYVLLKRYDFNCKEKIVWELFIDDDESISQDFESCENEEELQEWIEIYESYLLDYEEELIELLEKYSSPSNDRISYTF